MNDDEPRVWTMFSTGPEPEWLVKQSQTEERRCSLCGRPFDYYPNIDPTRHRCYSCERDLQ